MGKGDVEWVSGLWEGEEVEKRFRGMWEREMWKGLAGSEKESSGKG